MAYYANLLLESLQNLPSFEDIPPTFEGVPIGLLNYQIKTFLKTGRLLINFLCYAAKWSTEHDKLRNLSNHIEDLVYTARVVADLLGPHFTGLGNIEKKLEVIKSYGSYILHLSDMLENIELIMPETREFFKVPDWQPSNSQNAHENLASFLNFLLENTSELLNYKGDLIVPANNQTQILVDDLRFMITFLGDTPLHYARHKGAKDILTDLEVVANDAGSFLYLVFVGHIKEDMGKEINFALSDLLQKLELSKEKIRDYVEALESPISEISMTEELVRSIADSFLDYLMSLLDQKAHLIFPLEDNFKALHDDLTSLISSLKSIKMQQPEYLKIECFVNRVGGATDDAEYILDSFVVKGGPIWYFSIRISYILEEINLIKAELAEVLNDYIGVYIGVVQHNYSEILESTIPKVEDIVVGFEDETTTLKERLTSGPEKREVISIVGMAGLGKTTLAQNLYNDPLIVYHFHIRAWCFVSQVYQRRDLLLSILRSIIKLSDEICKMSDEDLANQIYKHLKGKRYLIVMDDIWNERAWNDLWRSFPDDKTGSRIIVTSRLKNIALNIEPRCTPLELRFLSEDECWDLLKEKVFQKQCCPQELIGVGKQIASRCQGLPLAVVVIGGLLTKMNKTENSWKQVAASLSSYVSGNSELLKDVLEKSYEHLPIHLKPCFVYCGVFPEGREIPSREMMGLWIAEGFIQRAEQKSLEEVAEEYLMDLISRSLVIVVQRRSNGGVKSCRIHDLFRDMCLRVAGEESFLKVTDSSFSVYEKHRRLCLRCHHRDLYLSPFGPRVRSVLAIFNDLSNNLVRLSCMCHSLRLLRVLNLSGCELAGIFPSEVGLLVHLRYLNVKGHFRSVPSSIGNLWNLEILMIKGQAPVELPIAILNLENLRHLHVRQSSIFSKSFYEQPIRNKTFQCDNLQTFSCFYINLNSEVDFLKCFPNLRKLRCKISASNSIMMLHTHDYPKLYFLSNLETLNVSRLSLARGPCRIFFPPNLKKLTLSEFHLSWEQMSTIGRLPKLEVLKLKTGTFDGIRWDSRDAEFRQLKFLELNDLNIAQWSVSSDQFPRLQRLLLQRCKILKEVPSSLVDISTLEMIEVNDCSPSATRSALEIQVEQEDNEWLKILVSAPDQEA